MLYNNKKPTQYEIPYGFKQTWKVVLDLITVPAQHFEISSIETIYLNGKEISLGQFTSLVDFGRDVVALTTNQAGGSGILTVIQSIEDNTINYLTLADMDVEFTGIRGVLGDMVDNTEPDLPRINHDIQKVDTTVYVLDQNLLKQRVSTSETNIGSIQTQLVGIAGALLNDVRVNGNSVVNSQTKIADIDLTGYWTKQERPNIVVGLNATGSGQTVSVNGVGGNSSANIVFTSDFAVGALGTVGISPSFSQPILDSITALEEIYGAQIWFTDDINLNYKAQTNLNRNLIFKINTDGATSSPQDEDMENINIIIGLKPNYTDYTENFIYVPKSLGIVQGRDIGLSYLQVFADNINNSTQWNAYNSFRQNTIIEDLASGGTYVVIYDVPRPLNAGQVIQLTNTQYYRPTRDMTPMPAKTIWSNLGTAATPGVASSLADVRKSLSNIGYDNFVNLIPTYSGQVIDGSSFNTYILSLVVDGNVYSSYAAIRAYLLTANNNVRYMLSNLGLLRLTYNAAADNLFLENIFTWTIIDNYIQEEYQKLIGGAVPGNVPILNAAGQIIDSGLSLADFASSEEGSEASTALQPTQVVDNLYTQDAHLPLSANQGYILDGRIQTLEAGGVGLGVYATYAERPVNTSEFPAGVYPNVGDYIVITADETKDGVRDQYAIYSINGGGDITYVFDGFIISTEQYMNQLIQSGSGNVISTLNYTPTTGVLTAIKGINTITTIASMGSGNVVSDIQLNGEILTQSKNINAITSIPIASTTQPGISQLSDGLANTSITMAATANAAKQLNDKIGVMDGSVVHKDINETLNSIKTLGQHMIVPSKTSIAGSGSATEYSTEAQITGLVNGVMNVDTGHNHNGENSPQILYSNISGAPTSFTPAGTAGGDLSGTYPNPTIKSNVQLAGGPTLATTPAITDTTGKIVNSTYITNKFRAVSALPASPAAGTFYFIYE